MLWPYFTLATALGSDQYAQGLDERCEFEKSLMINKVTWSFSNPPFTSIACTSFSRPTVDSSVTA